MTLAGPEELRSWAQEELREPLHILDGGKQRAWGTVVRLQAAGRVVWAKACADAFGHEPALTALIARVAPGHVLDPLAVDAERAWLLTPDGGVPLREGGPAAVGEWEALLVGYAELQRELVPRVDELLALRVEDLRPARLGEAHERICAELGDPRLPPLAPVVAEVAAVLDEHGLVTLEHNDLHLGNVLRRDGLRIFDWGDAVVGHPWAALDALRRVPEHAEHLQAAYLEVWGLSPSPELLRAALMFARLAKLDVWSRIDPVGREPWRFVAEEEIERWVAMAGD